MKIIALICAKGNSKGIKNKNLLKFKNTTLLGNSIKQAFLSKYINRVIVSTESQKIAKESLKNKAEVPFLRPSKLANDDTPEIQVWRHAIRFINKNNDLDYIVSVPTTSPLRAISDINKCVSKAIRENLDIVFTASKSSRNPYFNIVQMKNGKLERIASNSKIFFRRQDAPICYDLTTVCYVFKPKFILKNKNLFSGRTGFVEIPKHRAIDIDDKIDYKIAKFLSLKGQF